MNRSRVGFLLLLGIAALPAVVRADIDPNAHVVYARSRAFEADPDPCSGVDNCFTYSVNEGTWQPQDLWSAQASFANPNRDERLPVAETPWIWAVRQPGPDSPLIVEVGPGKFSSFICEESGWVTLRGSGREATIIRGFEGMYIQNCKDLSFLNLGAHGVQGGVLWHDGGFSTWVDTDLVAGVVSAGPPHSGAVYGWGDQCFKEVSDPQSVHYFHSSRFRTEEGNSSASTGFSAQCAQNWIFDSEITGYSNRSTQEVRGVYAGADYHPGDLRIFGSAIAATIGPDAGQTSWVAGVMQQGGNAQGAPGGNIRVFGGSIKVSAAGATIPTSVVGVRRIGHGFVDVRDTAFELIPSPILPPKPPAEPQPLRLVRRLHANPNRPLVISNLVWGAGTEPPLVIDPEQDPPEPFVSPVQYGSHNGADLYVETDCKSNGDCTSGENSGSEPHLMIYDAAFCTASTNPWFDVVTRACRVSTP